MIILAWAGEITLYLSGPVQDTFLAWVLYIACWIYCLLGISLVAKMDNVMVVIPKIWMVTFLAIMGPYLGIMVFEIAIYYASGWAFAYAGDMLPISRSLFLVFMKSWFFVFTAIYIAVVMFRCLGLLIAANRQKITDALRDAGV